MKRIVLFLTAIVAGGALMASAASASTTIGSQCTFSSAAPGVFTSPSLVAKSDGVITSWGYSLLIGGSVPPYEDDLYVLSPTGVPNQWTLSSTTTLTIADGGGSVASRVPIKAGQAIGTALNISGAVEGLVCSETGSAQYTSVSTTPVVGSTLTFNNSAPVTPDVYAVVEADADGDGYGDETQDECTGSAKFHTPCPTPKLAASQIAYKNGFQAAVTTDIPGSVQASATVKLPRSKGKKAKTLTFSSRSFATTPGLLTKVTLKWPSALKKALKSLSKSKKLSVKVTLTAPGILSNSTKSFTARIAGTKH